MTEQIAKRPRVLIVDDVRENIRVLAAILRDECDVSFALGGEDALAKVASAAPDIVLLDVEMPGMDGYEVLHRLHSETAYSSIPVIFVTARSDAADEERGLTLGAVDYIAKPFSPAVVKARVRNHVLLHAYSARLEHANAELERLATTDGLTGILNRRAFYEHAEAESARIARYGGESTVLALDIDHFKRVNDTYGHEGGDRVLVAFTGWIGGCLRKPDIFGRVGGEEFCIVAPNTDVAGARVVANRILETVRGRSVESGSAMISITTSIGLARFRAEDRAFGVTLARADAALYRAKNDGRDRLVVGAD